MDAKDRIIEEQRQLIEELRREIEELKLALAKATKDSSNSSKSPSSDIVKPPRKGSSGKAPRKKRKRGGQQGHQRKLRQPLPPERVDEAFVYELTDAEIRERNLTPTDQFEVIQHIELLDMPIHVSEHRLRKYLTADGRTVVTQVPELQGRPIFGPRLLAMIGWLKSRAHCSYTTIAVWMGDVLQVPVCRGYLSKLCNGVISDSVADAYEELKEAIPRQETLGSDESCLKNNGKKHWIWCVTTSLFTVFHIATSRGRKVLEELIGTGYAGIVHFDYFSSNCSFAWNFDIQAQYCWAHLIRDIRFLEKHPDNRVRIWSGELLDRSRRMFSAWHRRDKMSDEGRHRSLVMHRDKFLTIVRKPPDASDAGNISARFAIIPLADGSCYDMSEDYFRFMFAPGVEPTNNHTEQQVRHCVIDRRITQGTRSESGQRYHERMWTAIATCAKQGRGFFHFLHQSIAANLAGQAPPSLLPN
ncbi:MAG: IS66 family transposase [Pirellulales bacterium]|nr:IS66 family transposase [Pirellulales bacterium]